MPDAIRHEQDNGKTNEIRVGQKFAIDLKENPTTGYQWTDPHFDERFLGLEASEFESGKDVGVGGGGIRHFLFVAKLPGETPISLMNKRSWESPEAAAATFTITVRVVK